MRLQQPSCSECTGTFSRTCTLVEKIHASNCLLPPADVPLASTLMARNKRFRPTYVYFVISTMLALFMSGVVALLFTVGTTLTNQFKERMEFTLILKDNVPPTKVALLLDSLQRRPHIKAAHFVSKEEAARLFIEQTGEDFLDVLQYNPLFASINLQLHAAYTHPDSITVLEASLSQHPLVSEFYYERQLVLLLHKHLRIGVWLLLGILAVMVLVALSVMDSTVRLAMYAQRFLIRSMQLVGATRAFIMKPFLMQSVVHGLLASGLAIFLLGGTLRLLFTLLPELTPLIKLQTIIVIALGLLIGGAFFTLISTWFSVRKYLGRKIDELY